MFKQKSDMIMVVLQIVSKPRRDGGWQGQHGEMGQQSGKAGSIIRPTSLMETTMNAIYTF